MTLPKPVSRCAALFLIPVISSLFTGCESQGDERLAEKSRIEGEAQATEQLKKDKELLQTQISEERSAVDHRSMEMERSLTKLQDFYEDHAGHFEGTMTRGEDRFKIRISLFPSLPRYSDSRVRTPAEVESDLTTLSLSAQIVQWNPENEMSSVGCRVEKLRPNVKTGKLNIISSDCPSSYFLTLNRSSMNGTAQPSSNPLIFDIYAERVLTKKAVKKTAKKTIKKTLEKAVTNTVKDSVPSETKKKSAGN